MLEELDGQHLQLRYMTRFGCIGPDCEDHCCYGWRVDIDAETYRKMMVAAQFSAKDIAPRLASSIKIIPGSKKKQTGTRYQIRHGKDDACPMLDERNLCEIHKHFGHEMLSDVCAIYPRKLKRVGDHIELTATPSCPELTRQLILHTDAADVVPLSLDEVDRPKLQTGMDTRDVRPFYRAVVETRDLVVELLREDTVPLQDRLFLMLWFAKRTNEVLQKQTARGDLTLVQREMNLLRDAQVKSEILRRFAQIETPASVTLWIVRAMVRPHHSRHARSNWNNLANSVTGSYVRLRTILPSAEDEASHDQAAADQSESVMMTIGEVWTEYRRRRDRVRARIGARMDQFLRNYTIHNWVHRLPTEAKDLLTYTLRYLALQAVQKFVIYSAPQLQTALDEAEGMAPAEGDAHVQQVLDAVAVSAFYQLSRHIEHGALIDWLAEMLEKAGLFSMAGGVYLIRF
ncbi:MAG: hypothetical protein EP329_04410 [Deltaproteobacteria bacterium]|nr:MAG: hypothetical protein EP329_04410 [Deltaproteobacteria bacterium]